MSIPANGLAGRGTPAFLTQGFRPFFLAAGIWAALALVLWIVMFVTGAALPSRFDPLTWHIHEMLFGFVMAAVAGFLLTATPTGPSGFRSTAGRSRCWPGCGCSAESPAWSQPLCRRGLRSSPTCRFRWFWSE
jgi:hypothetical protein